MPRPGFVIPFSNSRNQDSLEKWLIPRLAQGIYKMIPERFTVPESKGMLQKNKTKGACQRDRRAN